MTALQPLQKHIMNTLRFTLLTLVAATMAACSSVPPQNVQLERANMEYGAVRDDAQAHEMAGLELKQAGDALTQARAAWAHDADPEQVDHLAHLARQHVAVVHETVALKTAEKTVAQASAQRSEIRLAARTQEADAAHLATDQARMAAGDAQRTANQATQASEQSKRDAAQSMRVAGLAQERNRELEEQLKALNAQSTPRGMVITLGDVLFDTDEARLKPGGMRVVDRLADILQNHPQRSVMVEGFTDTTGSADYNQRLSEQRADAVQGALVARGVQRARISALGHGESYPVAGNDSAGGRQLNRRVEIVLSSDGVQVAPR
jgi:outer membrane protein OmpA-like peptidoglycan-associated protein